MSRLAIIEREGMRFGLISEKARELAPADLPVFTPREIAILRQHAARCKTPLPLPLEIVRAILEVKRATHGAIEDWDRQQPSWQWLLETQHQTIDLDVAEVDRKPPAGGAGSSDD